MGVPVENHANRQYPPPKAPWVLAMTWRHLLFMHWPVRPENLRPFVPPELEIETFEGQAWLGVVPFLMRRTRARWLPPIPGVSDFPEMNVRTYVRSPKSGHPGVWFFSLDAAQPLAIIAARRTFHLAYMDARMRAREESDGWVHYESRRTGDRQLTCGQAVTNTVGFLARYRPKGPPEDPVPGTLTSFFTDRYCLYSWGKRLYRAEIHHPPWALQPAAAEVELNTMPAQLGIDAAAFGAPKLHYAREMHVRGWWPVAEDAGG